MKTRSIFFRNFQLTALIILVSLVIFGAFFSYISYNFILGDKRDTVSTTARVVANTSAAKSIDAELDDWDLRMTISTIGEASGTHISICDTDGIVCSCSDNDAFCPHIGSLVPISTIKELAENSGECIFTDLSGYYSDKRYTACSAVEDPYTDKVIGYVFASADVGSITSLWSSFFLIFGIIAIVVLIIALAMSWFTINKQVAPLKEMAEAAYSFGKGNMDVRVGEEYKRKDEIGALAKAFNQMADSLQSSEGRRREFIANISHELKTPMTTIAGYADGLLDGTIPWENRERYLTIISDETRRLARLVRKMLDISKLQSTSTENVLKNSKCDLCETVRMAILGLESKINGKNLDIDAQIPDEELIVCGEQDSIMQVTYNILDNAVKFAYPKSVIVLKIWKREEKAYVSIKNSGDSIAPDDLPMIFDRFHKSDKSRSMDREGVGLGLYIVKSIITSYGETISVNSENNETEFVFSLSIAK